MFNGPPKRYIVKAHMGQFEELFTENNGTATHYSGRYAGELGFKHSQSFTRFIHKETGCSFREYTKTSCRAGQH